MLIPRQYSDAVYDLNLRLEVRTAYLMSVFLLIKTNKTLSPYTRPRDMPTHSGCLLMQRLRNLPGSTQEGVICLGGPDVPRWHCSANELRAHDISFPEASMMIKECCSTVFGGKGDDQVGYSETILSRHLARAEVGTATATAPNTLVRQPHYACYCLR